MSQTLGTLSGTIVLQRALELTFTKYPLLRTISLGCKDLDGKAATALLNQAVTSRILSMPTVNDFGTGAGELAYTDVTCTLANKKEVHVAFALGEYSSTDRDLIDEQALPMSETLAKYIIKQVAGKWLAANFTATPITVASGWTRSNTLLAIKAALDDAGVPDQKRFLVANTSLYIELLKDPIIVAASSNSANGNAISTGVLPPIDGISVLQYPGLSTITALTAQNTIGFAGTPDSTVYLARAPKDPRELAPNLPFPGVYGYVSDAKSGFQVAVQQWINPDTLTVNNRLVWLDGYSVGNAANGLRVRTAAP